MEYLLRIEAVNFDQFIGDTEKISVVRGGGLALLFAPGGGPVAGEDRRNLLTWLEESPADWSPEVISVGASSGLYGVQLDSKEDADKLRADVRSWIASDRLLKHATFTVVLTPRTEDFRVDLVRLVALGNWEQMTASSLVWPAAAGSVCAFDEVRPASSKCMNEEASESVVQRYEEGRLYRQRLFASVGVGALNGYPFTHSLGGLAHGAGSSLDGRIAVIYVDGNRFGSLLGEAEASAQSVKEWDQKLRGLRAGLLDALTGL